jgi:hypothetical protein
VGLDPESLDDAQREVLEKQIGPLLKEHFGHACLVIALRMKDGEEATVVRSFGNDSYTRGLLYDGFHIVFPEYRAEE